MCGWLSKKKDDVKAKEVTSSDILATNDTVKAVPKPKQVDRTTTR